MTHQQTPEPAAPQARGTAPSWGNSGFGGPPLPKRTDDRAPRTPSAAARRESFALKHPEIPVATRRDGTRLLFEVTEPGKAAEVYDNPDAMMDDLEARYP